MLPAMPPTPRMLSVVAEVEERSPQTTPTPANEGAGPIERMESTHSGDIEWEVEDDDTLPLI